VHNYSQNQLDECDLIAKAKSGDRWAFSELVRKHRQGVINIIYRMCGNADIAEDAAQETFVKAWQHLGKYKPKSAFKNWLYKIGLNTARNALRRERDTVDVEDIIVIDKNLNPEQSIASMERTVTVQNAIRALPEASRSVLILREYEDLSYRDIAETLDIPVGTVMSRLNYARQLLRKSLSHLLEVV
jgi:RNA polymerase sigma-70 factor (ECF subfamily)